MTSRPIAVGTCRECKHRQAAFVDPNYDGHLVCLRISAQSFRPPGMTVQEPAIPRGPNFEPATLVTLPSFGCVLFEQREPESEAAQAKV